MNRLQKKCLFVTAGGHLLLIVILLVGPGFFPARPELDDVPKLDVIPDNLIKEALSSGVKDAQLPPPTPPETKPEVAPPEPVKPLVKPEPVKTPDPEPVKPPEKLNPDDLEPVVKPPKKPEPHKIEINLKTTVHKLPVKPDNSAAEAREQAKADQRARERQAKAFRNAVSSIKANATTATRVEMPGTSSVSYANYASAVKTKYEAAWIPPDDAASDDADVRVSVVIARDGTVVSAHVLTKSGDVSVDRSVQRALDRVNFIAPFPDGSKEKEKTFIINFNLKAKRMLG